MPQYLDIYFLLNDRNIERVRGFIDQYLPLHEESAMDYCIPIYSDSPTMTFDNIFDLFNYLEKNENCDYIVYLRSLNDSSVIKHVIIQFTDDGKIIVGVSVNGREPSDAEIGLLFHKLKRRLNADAGYITVEEPPSSNSVEFLEFSKNRYVPKVE